MTKIKLTLGVSVFVGELLFLGVIVWLGLRFV